MPQHPQHLRRRLAHTRVWIIQPLADSGSRIRQPDRQRRVRDGQAHLGIRIGEQARQQAELGTGGESSELDRGLAASFDVLIRKPTLKSFDAARPDELFATGIPAGGVCGPCERRSEQEHRGEETIPCEAKQWSGHEPEAYQNLTESTERTRLRPSPGAISAVFRGRERRSGSTKT
jgi:hypothetical protein